MKEAWKQIAQVYNTLLPPNRPSKRDLEIYGEFIKPKLKKDINILLFGSTPELRDLLHSTCLVYNANLTMVDMTKDMYEAMTSLMESRNPKEKFLNKMWQDTGLESKSCDLIIADEIIVNIPLEGRDQLFSEIVRLLKDDGLFITRHNEITSADKVLSKDSIREEFQKAVDLKQTVGQTLNNISKLYIHYLAASRPNQGVSIRGIMDQLPHIQESIKDNPEMRSIGNEIVARAKTFESSQDQTWLYKDREHNEQELKRYFKIAASAKPDNYLKAKNNTIYCLSPIQDE